MLKIEFKQELFDEHIEEISPKISTAMKNANRNDECFKYLEDEKEIKNLLSANTFQLKLYIDFFEKNFPSSIEKDSELNKALRDVFENEYKNWSSRKIYGAYKFVERLDLKTCPYCNRNYTFIVNEENGKLRPEIDHFYPKSIYPFLAMSFYNLIPSCSICNHTKNDKVKKNLENPYDIKNEDYKFTYVPNSVDFAMVEQERYNFNNFEIKIIGNKSNIELFKLEELYKQHKDVVLELLIKKAYYPKSYIQELSRFGFTKDEIYRYLFSNYKQADDLHKRPLSKLIKDISTELGLIL
jgi:hypothetical protein